MKRFTLILASLFLTIGAMAQTPIKRADFDATKNYRVYSTSRSSGTYAIAPNDAASAGVMATYDATAANQVWQFIPGTGDNEGKYLLYNNSTKTYLGYVWGAYGATLYTDVNNSDVGYYEIGSSDTNDEYFTFYHSGGSAQTHWLHNEAPSLNGWNGNGHEFFYLEEVTEEIDYVAVAKEQLNTLLQEAQSVYEGLANTEFTEAVALNAAISAAQNVYDDENAELEAVNEQITLLTAAKNAAEPYPFVESALKTIEAGKYFIYYTDENSVKHYLQTSGANSVVTVTENPEYYEIATGTVNGGKYSKAYALKMNGLYISNTSLDATNIETKDWIQLWTSQVIFEKDGKAAIRLTNATDVDGWHGNYFINKGETEGATIASDPSLGDELFFWTIEEIGAAEKLEALIETAEAEYAANSAMIGTTPGCVVAASVEALAAAIEVAKAVEVATESDVTALQEAIDGIQIVPVTAGTYMIVNAKPEFEGGKVLSAYAQCGWYGTYNNPGWATLDENDPLQYWTLEDAGEGKFNVKATYEGSYITSVSSLSENATATEFVFVGKKQFNIVQGTDVFHANLHGWGVEASNILAYDGKVDSPSAWTLTRVDETPAFIHTLTVGDAGYATLVLGYNATVPAIEGEGNGVFAATLNGEYVDLNKVEGVLPANTAVVIKAAAGTELSFAYSSETATEVTTDLVGTLYNKYIAPGEGNTAYVLGVVNDVVGFYKAALNQVENTAFKNNANKAYLVVPASGAEGVASYSFRFPGTTGVEEVKGENGEVKAIYDLTGRRVENIAAPGIYIVNGVKRVVR